MAFDPYIHYKYNFKVKDNPPSSKDGPDLSGNRSKDAASYFDYPLTFNQGEGVDKYTSPERGNCQVYCRKGTIASGFFFPDAGSSCGGDWERLKDQFLPTKSWFRTTKKTVQVDGGVYVLPGGSEAHRTKITAVTHPQFFNKPIPPAVSGAIAENNRWILAHHELRYSETGRNADINNRYKLSHHFSTFGMKFWCSGEGELTESHSEKCPDGFGRPGPPPKSTTKNFSYDWDGGEACLSCIEPEAIDPLGTIPVKDTECLAVRFSGDGLLTVEEDYAALMISMNKEALEEAHAFHGSGSEPSNKLDMVLGEQRRLIFGTNELRINTSPPENWSNIGGYPWDKVGMGQSFVNNKYSRKKGNSPDEVAGRKAAEALSHFEMIGSGTHSYTGAVGRFDGQTKVTLRAVREMTAHPNPCGACPAELGCETLDEERIWIHMIDTCEKKQGYKIKVNSVVNRGLIPVPEALVITSISDRYHKAGGSPSGDTYLDTSDEDEADYAWNPCDRTIHSGHPTIKWKGATTGGPPPGDSKVHVYVWKRSKKSQAEYDRDLADYGDRWKCVADGKETKQMSRWGQPELVYASTAPGGGTEHLIGKVGSHEGVEYANLNSGGKGSDIATGKNVRYKVQVMVENSNGVRGNLSDAVYFSIDIPSDGEGVWGQ